jgi:ceramide glucosyltransferase
MLETLQLLLLLLVTVSWVYWLVAWWLTHRFFRSRPRAPADYTPPVSLLKPVRGLDAQALANFSSFCQQHYPEYELLFGFADADDPGIAVVRQLQRTYRELTIRLVTGPVLGPNRKASLLHHLVASAQYDILVISDSDMRVTPDYLRRVVAPLEHPATGLVTCCYRGENAETLPAGLEALYIGTCFLPSVIIANKIFKFGFAMGSTAALRRIDLARLGGFRSIAQYLADDYQLGARIAELGLRVQLSEYVVATVLGATSFRELWHRETRWNRCARVSRPWCYLGLFITFSTPLALLYLLLSGLAPIGWSILAVSVAVRWLASALISTSTGDLVSRRWLLWLPVRDVLTSLAWLAGGLGQLIVWRGDRFILRSDGRMEPAPSTRTEWLRELMAWRP